MIFYSNQLKKNIRLFILYVNQLVEYQLFFEKCLNVLADKYVFLLDAAEQSDFATAFCSEACKNSSIRNIMQNFADLKFGEKSQNFISSLLKSSPYGGEILSHITEKPSASHIYIGAFPSIYEEIIFPTINEMRKTKQVIFNN